MSPLRQRMMEDMKLAGLAPRTQDAYVRSVYNLAAHYMRSPDQLSEDEVRRYILAMVDRGAARGTFKTCHYGLQFLYRRTLGLDWALFSKKGCARPGKSGCRKFYPMPRSGGFWRVSGALFIGPASA
jgi:Phage integrase, N-terminal SAM-like domain